MFDLQKYYANYTAQVQPQIPEPVLAVGLLSHQGRASAGAAYFVSPLAAMIMRSGKKKLAGGLPKEMLAAVTQHRLYLFEYRQGMGGLKVKGDPIMWERSWFQVHVDSSSGFAHGVRFSFPDGSTVALEASTGMGMSEFNVPLLQWLTTPVPQVRVQVHHLPAQP